MILKEFEGKQLLQAAGLQVPRGVVVSTTSFAGKSEELEGLQYPVYVKAQVLHGNRELQDLIRKVTQFSQLESQVIQLLSKKDQFGQEISEVLIEESVNFKSSLYISLSYDTKTRGPVLQFSQSGGTGMDDRGDTVETIPVSILNGVVDFPQHSLLLPVVQQLFTVFVQNDASLVEINPLVETEAGYVCLDAKIELEGIARYRHPEWEQYGARTQAGRPPTDIEERAHAVSRMDTRGVAGESFFEFEGGTIGVMASGGGASTLAMDALLAEGLQPANYTEYSGNPTREKVHELTRVVLSLPNLEALYVVGSNANFTDIYETLAGVVDGLLEADLPDSFSVLIRRGGPRWEEAFKMVTERLSPLTQKGLKLKLFGPDFSIVKTARELKRMIKE